MCPMGADCEARHSPIAEFEKVPGYFRPGAAQKMEEAYLAPPKEHLVTQWDKRWKNLPDKKRQQST